MTTIKLIIAYDGTDFHGFAKQRGLRTVQGTLEETLGGILKVPIEVYGSGRTDKGVHARAQVVHFEQPYGPPAERYPYLLRRALPNDIVVVGADAVAETFHARFSAVGKTYRYALSTATIEDVFRRRYVWHLNAEPNWPAMTAAARHLLGYHDFTTFCAAATPVEDKRRRVDSIELTHQGAEHYITVTGNGFLQYMVRIIVGTLVDVGFGRIAAQQIPEMMAAKDRRAAGQTAPSQGLTLWQVYYGQGKEDT